MNRAVRKEKLLEYISRHPAAVKRIINPTTELYTECVKKNYDCIDFIPKEAQTEEMLLAYVQEHNWGVARAVHGNPELIAKLSLDAVKIFLEKDGSLIVNFPQATKEMWMDAVLRGSANIKDIFSIPEGVLCEELLIAIVKTTYNNSIFVPTIPEKMLTDTLLTEIIDREADLINKLPQSKVTKSLVMFCLSKDPHLNELRIPADVWDAEIAEEAAKHVVLEAIPKHLITKSMVLNSIRRGKIYNSGSIPRELRGDMDVKLTYALHHMYYDEEIDKSIFDEIKKEESRLDVIKLGIKELESDVSKRTIISGAIARMGRYVTNWVPVLELWPEAITNIAKPDQTTEHIVAALHNRKETDNLETIATAINLAKVTKEIAPLLLNVENSDVKDFVERKFAPPRRADSVNADEVIMDITPQEYRDINR